MDKENPGDQQGASLSICTQAAPKRSRHPRSFLASITEMADPISLATSIISIVSTTATFSARLQNAAQQFGDSNPELQRQLEDISVLLAVLQECKSLFVSGVQIPLAAEGAMKACASRHNNLFTVMNRIERCHSRRRSAIFGFLQVPRMITLEGDRRSAFHAFRDSVLLLRDLISEYVIFVHGNRLRVMLS